MPPPQALLRPHNHKMKKNMRKSSTLEPNSVPTGLDWDSCNLLGNTWFRDSVVLIVVTGLTLDNRRVALSLKVSIRKRIS